MPFNAICEKKILTTISEFIECIILHVGDWHYLDFEVTKPVFGVSDKARLKPVSSATETSKSIVFSLVAS